MKTLFLTSAAALLLAAPVFAGGAAEPAPGPVTVAPTPIPVGADWTGPSVGLQLGYGDVSTDGPALDGDGALLGLRAYYDWDFGSFILGGGLQYDTADIDIGGVTDLDSVLRAGLRGGVDLGNSWAYATAGYALAETSTLGDSDGYFAGVGYEYLVTDTVSLGGEVLYHRFSDFDTVPDEAEATTAALSVNFRF